MKEILGICAYIVVGVALTAFLFSNGEEETGIYALRIWVWPVVLIVWSFVAVSRSLVSLAFWIRKKVLGR